MVPQLAASSLWLGGVLLAVGLLVHRLLNVSRGAGTEREPISAGRG